MKNLLNIFVLAVVFFSKAAFAEVTIVQFVEVGPLNLNKKGIVEILEENNIPHKYYNAQGQATLAKQIVNKVMSEESDLIITITTPVSLLAASSRASDTKPIVFSAVSDPISAKIMKEDNYLVNHITGASDHPPIDETFNIIEHIFKAKRIGVLYCNSEPNSVGAIKEIKKKYGDKYEIIEAVVTNSSMVKSRVDNLINMVDVVFIPLDSTVLSSLDLATKILAKHNIPVISNDPDTLAKGVTIAVGFNEYEVGKEAGRKAVRIVNAIKNKDDLADLKVTTPTKYEIKINKKMITSLGINLPADMIQYLN